MKQKSLLKTLFLLLFALVAGSGSAWAESYTIGWGAATGTEGTYTNFDDNFGTVRGILSFSSAKNSSSTTPACNANSSELRLYYGSNGSGGSITLTPATGITITGFVMTTSTTPSVNYTVDGGSAISVTASNNAYTVNGMSASNSLTIQNVNTTNTQLRIKTIQITYTIAPSYTIYAQSNNTAYGTVSLSGETITASPTEGHRVSTTNPYTISPAESATVVQNGNDFTVTPTANTTVTINFEAIPTHTVSFSVNGTTSSSESYTEGADITFPTNPADVNDMIFVGWYTEPYSNATTAPDFVNSATMGTQDVTYYAIFATIISDTPESWTETSFENVSTSDVFVFSDGRYAMSNDNGTSGAPSAIEIIVEDGKITSTVNSNMKWKKGGSASGGYTFYSNSNISTWMYCNTTASSSSNNNIRVGTGDRKTWTFDNDGYLVTKDSYTKRYLSIYNNSDFRGYIYTNNSVIPKFYKYNPRVSIYGDYCTTLPVEVTVTSAGLATFACDNALDYTNVSGLEAYIAQEENGTIALLKKNKVPAGTGVLLRATDGGTSFNVPVASGDMDNVQGNLFVRGTGAEVASVETLNDGATKYYNYILNIVENKLGFYKAAGQTVATNRAYLRLVKNNSQENGSGNVRIDLNFEDESGISVVKREATASNRYYDLQGRSVMQPTKGLYIVNGKKVVVK